MQGTPKFLLSEYTVDPALMATNLRALLHHHAISQYRLAREMGVTDRAVRNWVRGESPPSISNLRKLADLFELEPSWFYTDHSEIEAAA
jgi:transcriptional regulator with XRE-family HTH domain